jgi:hypothetical protein
LAIDVIVEGSPGRTVLGFAEQVIVGGSYAWTRKPAVQLACWPGRMHSETWPETV